MLIASCEGTRMEPVSAGMHMAVCCAVTDLGLRKQVFKEQERISRKVLLMWELPDETFADKDGNTQPRTMSKQYTLSLHEKAGLTKMLQSWRGKPFTSEELKGFDLRQIVGKGCQLSVIHEQGKDGQTYANISAVVGIPKGTAVPQPTHTIIYDLDEPDALDTISLLPDWIQKVIRESITYQEKADSAERPLWDENDEEMPF